MANLKFSVQKLEGGVKVWRRTITFLDYGLQNSTSFGHHPPAAVTKKPSRFAIHEAKCSFVTQHGVMDMVKIYYCSLLEVLFNDHLSTKCPG